MLNAALQKNRVDKIADMRKKLGSKTFLYYRYIDKYKVAPKDLQDLADGVLYDYIEVQEMKRARKKIKN